MKETPSVMHMKYVNLCNFNVDIQMICGSSYKFRITVVMIVSLLVPFYTPFASAGNLTSQLTQWFVPLDLGKQLKIQCFNGSFVEFVSECTTPETCKSLLLLQNDTLGCIPSSQFDKNIDQLIYP